jgi:hypothetical protein
LPNCSGAGRNEQDKDRAQGDEDHRINLFVVTQIADPIKTADGTEITKPEQLKDAKVKSQFDAGMKKTRALFTEGRAKCIINDSEAGYFQTGGKADRSLG